MNGTDRTVVRELAEQVAAIAALPVQQETINQWKALNGLNPVRPMVLIDHVPWHEMDVDEELALKTEDSLCRSLEQRLRQTLYAWRHMRADMVVEPCIRIPKVIHGLGEDLGITRKETRAITDPANRIVSHHYIDQFQTETDLDSIQTPDVILDEEATARIEQAANEALNGVLEVRMEGHFPRFTPWDRIAEWRGAQNTLMDLAVNPEFMHQIIHRATEAYLGRLSQLEEKGLLGHDQMLIKQSGAYTNELPAPGFDPAKPRPKDIWSSGMAQIFASASPAMHKEFELDYAIRWYEKFGLVYYGCCEPLHDRIDVVSQIPNLRKLSMSPWVDQERGAEAIESRFVFSRKPNPTFLAGHTWDADAIRADLQQTMDICSRYDCPVEFILQDISTVGYQPQRLWEWTDIAMQVVR